MHVAFKQRTDGNDARQENVLPVSYTGTGGGTAAAANVKSWRFRLQPNSLSYSVQPSTGPAARNSSGSTASSIAQHTTYNKDVEKPSAQ